MITPETHDWEALLAFAQSVDRFPAPAPSATRNKRSGYEAPGKDIARDEFTEYGHALAFVDRYGDRILRVSDEQAWYVWEGHRWVKDHSGQVFTWAARYGVRYKEVLKATAPDANASNDAKSIYRQRMAMANRLGSNAGLKAIVELASHDGRIQVRSTDFDTGVEELNTPAGVVDLRTGRTTPPDSKVLVRRSTAVAPEQGDTPIFSKFIDSIFEGDEDKINWVQTQLGITLLGAQPTQQFIYCKGSKGGADGKSRLMELSLSLMGKEEGRGYATVSNRSVFEKANSERHSTELAKLAGVRMVVSSEIGSTKTLDADKIKGMVAGDTMTGRFMRADEVVFAPQFMLWVMSNHHAKVDSTDGAFWRRAAVLNFTYSTPLSERVPNLDKTIFEEEGPAVLAWMIQGAMNYLNHGFLIPDAVINASKEYRDSVDTVTAWLEDTVTPEEGAWDSNTALRASYDKWCKVNRMEPVGPNKFGDALVENGYPRERGPKGTRGHSGLTIVNQYIDSMGI